nr:hypothetical protein [Tanacetum cinerariifolium]
MSLKEAEKESTKSDYDEEARVTGSMVKSSKEKKLKKLDFATEDGRHIHLSEEQINNQKKLDEEAKTEAAKQEEETRKSKLIDLLCTQVVHKDDVTYEVVSNFKVNDMHLGKEILLEVPTEESSVQQLET